MLLHNEFWAAEVNHKATHRYIQNHSELFRIIQNKSESLFLRELALHDFLRIEIVPGHLYTYTVRNIGLVFSLVSSLVCSSLV